MLRRMGAPTQPDVLSHPRVRIARPLLAAPTSLTRLLRHTDYRERSWPADVHKPYQIKLDSGELIYAHFDRDGSVNNSCRYARRQRNRIFSNAGHNVHLLIATSRTSRKVGSNL